MVGLRIIFSIFLCTCGLQSNPIVSKITNSSDIGYMVIHHTDQSSCSLHDKKIILHAHQMFEHPFLLESGKPSLILRPCYYSDAQTGQKINFLDSNNQVIDQNLNQAFNLWKQNKGKGWRKIQTAYDWLQQWIGGDIVVLPHDVQFFGYLLNRSRVIAQNNTVNRHSWLSFSKGIFAKLLVELHIVQDKNKPVSISIHTLHGEGGVCVDGLVEKI